MSKLLCKETYVDEAEKVIQKLDKDKWGGFRLTTSKIRNIMAMSADIYNSLMNESNAELSEESSSRIDYLRVRILYEAGRDDVARDFIQKAKLIEILKEMDKTKEEYILFYRYMEALVAFHKYYGGKDK